MRGHRGLWLRAGLTAAVVLLVVAVLGVMSANAPGWFVRPAFRCLPARLVVEPHTAAPGGSVTVSSPAADCDLGYPPGHTYDVILRHREVATAPQRVRVDADGRFAAAIAVPASFPLGYAVVSVTGSPFDDCDDRGSCVGYAAELVVE